MRRGYLQALFSVRFDCAFWALSKVMPSAGRMRGRAPHAARISAVAHQVGGFQVLQLSEQLAAHAASDRGRDVEMELLA
jgi:hypothetical protein